MPHDDPMDVGAVYDKGKSKGKGKWNDPNGPKKYDTPWREQWSGHPEDQEERKGDGAQHRSGN